MTIPEGPVVVMSSAGFLYGTVSSITWNDIWIINTTYRRRWGYTVKKHKHEELLLPWEKVSPPRKMLAVNGKLVSIRPPKEV